MTTSQLLRSGLPVFAGLCLSLAVTLAEAVPLFDNSLFETSELAESSDAELAAVLRLVNNQQIPEAEAAIRDIVERRPLSAPAHEILGTVLALQGKLPGAVLALEQAVELSPEQATALTKLGDIALALGDETMARNYFLQAIAVLPDERRAHQRLGRIHERQGDVETAIHHYRLGIQGTGPGYLGVKLNLAQLYVKTGEHKKAIPLLAPFVNEDEAPPEVLPTLAAAELGAGHPEAALATFERGLGVTPRAPALLRGAVVALIRLERAEQAVTYARQLAGQSAAPQDHFLLASLLEQTGDIPQAEVTYRHILTLDSQFWPAFNNLATLLVRRGDVSEGLDYAQKAYELSGDQPVQPAHTYGWALLEKGDHLTAVKVLESAKHRQASHTLTRYHLGVAYQKAGQTSAAKQELQAALELNDQFEFAADARQRLLSL